MLSLLSCQAVRRCINNCCCCHAAAAATAVASGRGGGGGGGDTRQKVFIVQVCVKAAALSALACTIILPDSPSLCVPAPQGGEGGRREGS